MGVLMQAFFWDCPREDQQEHKWRNFAATKLNLLQSTGFTALWLLSDGKGSNLFGNTSLEYDVYDWYDLGTHDQKGSVNTWFGSEPKRKTLVSSAHDLNLKVYANLVLNHNNGADAEEFNPILRQNRWTLFKPASKVFTSDWTYFNPSPYPDSDPGDFGDMPDLCQTNPAS